MNNTYAQKIAQALSDAGLDEMECSLVAQYIDATKGEGEFV